jgi:hypothetical protein
VFQAQLLENAEMNLLQKKLFKITSQPVTDYFAQASYSNGAHVEESIDIITGTKDMPFDTCDAGCPAYSLGSRTRSTSTASATLASRLLSISTSAYILQQITMLICLNTFYGQRMGDQRRSRRSGASVLTTNWMMTGRINHPKYWHVEIHGWNLIHRTVNEHTSWNDRVDEQCV